LNQQIDRLVLSHDPDEVKAIYRDWAENYNEDLSSHGYVAPKRCCELLTNLVSDRSALVYDAGCGTGLVGSILQDAGYSRIHGADFSPDMLAQAGMSGAYTQLTHADYSAPLTVDDEIYDVIISVGVYTARFHGHFIPEMLRCLKPGGVFVFTCRERYYENEVDSTLSAAATRGEILDVTVSREPYILQQKSEAYYITLFKSPRATAIDPPV